MGAFWTGLATAQAAGVALRVSCATPVAGPIGGFLGVGFASALAGQAAIKCRMWEKDHKLPWQYSRGIMQGVHSRDVLVDAALGIALFKFMGGRFRSVMPSDLLKVGAIGKESLPAGGPAYATEEKRGEILRFFRRDGCHHCGTRKGPSIGDHMPPNKMVAETIKAMKKTLGLHKLFNMPYVRKAAASMNIPVGPPRQRYYPQCQSCSQKQASAVRMGRSILVMHEVLHHGGKGTAWHYAGVLLGMRHNFDRPSSSSYRGGSGQRGYKSFY